MPIIDFHNHYYPPAYLDALRAGPERRRGDHRRRRQSAHLLSRRLQHRRARPSRYRLPRAGADRARRRYPGHHAHHARHARRRRRPPPRRFAALVNDAFADVIETKRGRFTALATLPLNDPAAASRELERACRQLHFPARCCSATSTASASTIRAFWPLYELRERSGRRAVHPSHPSRGRRGHDRLLADAAGRLPLDTTLAAAKLVFSGIPERYPAHQWVLCHLGGAIPYLAERLDRGFEAFSECRANIPRPPSEYLKQFYLRHRQLRSRRAPTRHRFRRRRPHPGRQRLSRTRSAASRR